jgi:hypothetical protein
MVGVSNDSQSEARFLGWVPEELRRGLDTSRDSACGLWPDLSIAWVNRAWQRFGETNGAGRGGVWGVGRSFLDGVGTPLREYYRAHLVDVLESGHPWESEYECSSPHLFRLFRMSVETVGDARALLVRHQRVVQRPHDRSCVRPQPADACTYVDEHGLIAQCVHCRRVRRAGRAEHWDWVPLGVEAVPDHASGSLCPQCLATRYPDFVRSA